MSSQPDPVSAAVSRVGTLAGLLFVSGLCALVYQSVWLRQLRLIFGASTASSAAVVAIFMAGLGLGSAILGRRMDRSANPLRFYGWLELGVAGCAAISPLLLFLTSKLYFATGGSFTLGIVGATLIRLVLAAVILGPATFLMGGTFPAAARAVEIAADIRRRKLAILYGVNTLGAVTGVTLSTFVLLETFGNRGTLWLASLVNLFIGLLALLLAQKTRSLANQEGPVVEDPGPAAAPPRFVLAAAAIVGFAFFLMELVWYRMLTPLLGGTTFTFGLILAIALVGVGLGSTAYAFGIRRSSLLGFALTCSLEALFLAIPYALGDRVAVLALLLRPLGGIGFGGFVIGWVLVVFLIVFPASFVAGFQFPLLIGLLGEGNKRVGSDVGRAYAANTVGAIAGSIAGGFGFLPLFSAPGTWLLAVLTLCALSVITGFLGLRRQKRVLALAGVASLAVAALMLFIARGPTAAWRHTPIGAGRVDQVFAGKNTLRNFLNARRRTIEWEVDGVESTVALSKSDGYAFLVNGKSDGHARLDAGTQVMGGLLGAILIDQPRKGLVIGLGTGSTAGWLAAMDSIERVDVVEIEPSILDVARACQDVNHQAMKNPKVRIFVGDGREFVLTSDERYDIISSEPSNPYRAGIASLLTTEFYQAVANRLEPQGVFLQFLQAYEIDGRTLRILYASLRAVFPYVETYETRRGDLLLVGTRHPNRYDADVLRARLQREPIRTAVKNVWRIVDLEGFLAHYVAGPQTSATLASDMPRNTDDRTIVEYAFARTLGDVTRFDVAQLRELAVRIGDGLPDISGSVDLSSIQDQRLSMVAGEGARPEIERTFSPDQVSRARAHLSYIRGDYQGVVSAWITQSRPPHDPTEILTFAEAVADLGDERALTYIDQLKSFSSVEADLLLARLRFRQGRFSEAAGALQKAFVAYRSEPWALPIAVSRSLPLSSAITRADPSQASLLHQALSEPFSVRMADEERRLEVLRVASLLEGGRCGPLTLKGISTFEPDVPWQEPFLKNRAECYRETNSPLAGIAGRELEEFLAALPPPLSAPSESEEKYENKTSRVRGHPARLDY